MNRALEKFAGSNAKKKLYEVAKKVRRGKTNLSELDKEYVKSADSARFIGRNNNGNALKSMPGLKEGAKNDKNFAKKLLDNRNESKLVHRNINEKSDFGNSKSRSMKNRRSQLNMS